MTTGNVNLQKGIGVAGFEKGENEMISEHGHRSRSYLTKATQLVLYSLLLNSAYAAVDWKRLESDDGVFFISFDAKERQHGANVSSDGRISATGDNTTLRLSDISDAQHPKVLRELSVGNTYTSGIAFSPDNQLLATVHGDANVRLWDVRDPKTAALLTVFDGGADADNSVSFSPDGRMLAVGSDDKSIRLWDIRLSSSPKLLAILKGSLESVGRLAFSPDGKLLASTPEKKIPANGNDPTIRLWDIHDPIHATFIQKLEIPPNAWVSSLAFSPSVQLLAYTLGSGEPSMFLWDIRDQRSPKLLKAHNERGEFLRFSDDGMDLKFQHTAGHGPEEWDWPLSRDALRDHVRNYQSRGVSLHYLTNQLIRFGVVDSNNRILIATADNKVVLYDRQTYETLTVIQTTGAVQSCAVGPDSRYLAFSTQGGNASVTIWDIRNPTTPHLIAELPDSAYMSALEFSPNGNLLGTADNKGRVRLWDLSDLGKSMNHFEIVGVKGNVQSMRFNSDSSVLELSSWIQETQEDPIQLWDITNLEIPRLLPALDMDNNQTARLAFSPDGRQMAVVSSDGNVQIWKLDISGESQKLTVISTPAGSKGVVALAVSGDNKKLATAELVSTSGGDNLVIRIWAIENLTHPKLLQSLFVGYSSVSFLRFTSDAQTLILGQCNGGIMEYLLPKT